MNHSSQASAIPVSRHLLSGKVALITGASRGIDAAAARVFAEAGATIVLVVLIVAAVVVITTVAATR